MMMIEFHTFSEPTVAIEETTRILGKNYTLTCTVFGLTNPNYTWEKDGTELTSAMGQILSFTPLRLSDAGLYTCIINDDHLYRDNKEVTITGICMHKYHQDKYHRLMI